MLAAGVDENSLLEHDEQCVCNEGAGENLLITDAAAGRGGIVARKVDVKNEHSLGLSAHRFF